MKIKSVFSLRKWTGLLLATDFARYKMCDSLYLRLEYYAAVGRILHLKHPKGLGEKIQWLKLYNRRPEYVRLVDKFAVRDYIKETLGEDYLIPLIGAWDRAEDIDFDKLPDKFVLKCNHNSGKGMCICPDKSKLDAEKARKELDEGIKQDYFSVHREWPYKDVKRKIVAERFMTDDGNGELKDYKFFNFNGVPTFVQVDFDRFNGHKQNIYSLDWKLLDFSFSYPRHPEVDIPRPDNLDEMIKLSRKLSEGHSFVRTDFYSINGKTYFGEITFFPSSGFACKFFDKAHDIKYGNMITLPEKRV